MLSKIKYVLFDFSDNFKNDFITMFKKSIAFLVIGVIMYALKNVNETVGYIGAIGILIFGIMWGKNLVTFLASIASLPQNVMIKWTCLFILFIICFCLGYIYFAWCVVKMIIYLIKKHSSK
jgi:hypothetical protein